MRPRWLRTRVLRPILGAFELLAPVVAWSLLCSEQLRRPSKPGRLYRSAQMEATGSLGSRVRDHQHPDGPEPPGLASRIRLVSQRARRNPGRRGDPGRHAVLLLRVDVPRAQAQGAGRGSGHRRPAPCSSTASTVPNEPGWSPPYDILLQAGSTLAEAEAQFSAWYMYFGVGDGVVTHQHLEAYRDLAPGPVPRPRRPPTSADGSPPSTGRVSPAASNGTLTRIRSWS